MVFLKVSHSKRSKKTKTHVCYEKVHGKTFYKKVEGKTNFSPVLFSLNFCRVFFFSCRVGAVTNMSHLAHLTAHTSSNKHTLRSRTQLRPRSHGSKSFGRSLMRTCGDFGYNHTLPCPLSGKKYFSSQDSVLPGALAAERLVAPAMAVPD